MTGRRLLFFASFLSLSLYANHALARVSNITFSDGPTSCSPVTVSWHGGVPPFTVVFLSVDPLAEPRPDGTIPGILVRAPETGNARRVVWTAAVQAEEVLVAVVRDGLEQNASSGKTVVQASNNLTCLEALVRCFGSVTLAGSASGKCSDNADQQTSTTVPTAPVALPSLSTRLIGTSTNVIASASVSPSEALIGNQRRILALPILLTLFTIGTVVGISVYGFCVFRGGAPKRSDPRFSDIEAGRYGGDTRMGILGTYSRQLGRNITRKFSAMSSQLSRRPTAVVATEKPGSFTILPEETESPTPQEVSGLSPESRADVVAPSPIIGLPILPVHAITASRPASSATVSTASWTTETGTGLSPRPISTATNRGLRPAPSKSNMRGQGRSVPVPPALDLSRTRRETRRQYGLPTVDNRMEAMRPRSRSKSVILAEPSSKRVSSSATQRRASAGAVAALDSPPAHFAQVPISALPPATPDSSNIRPYSQIRGRTPGPGATIQTPSRRKRSNTLGSIMVVQDVPFVIEPPAIPRFNQPTARPGTDKLRPDSGPPSPCTIAADILDPLVLPPLSPSRSDTGSHVDPFYDIPQTATTTFTRYSMALPESGALLPASFSVAQDEVIPPLPPIPTAIPMVAKAPSRPISRASGVNSVK